jgi:hypothetical protein
MLEAAREAAAGDDLLLALIDQTAIDLQAGRTRLAVLRLSSLGLPAGGEARWLLPFYADAPAEIAALGPQGTTLELAVADAAGHPVCLESDPSPRAYCAFVPAQNGPFTVTLRNPGPAAAAVALVTN